MSHKGDTDRGRLFGFETQHIFGLAISSRHRATPGHPISSTRQTQQSAYIQMGFQMCRQRVKCLLNGCGIAKT